MHNRSGSNNSSHDSGVGVSNINANVLHQRSSHSVSPPRHVLVNAPPVVLGDRGRPGAVTTAVTVVVSASPQMPSIDIDFRRVGLDVVTRTADSDNAYNSDPEQQVHMCCV